jgi:hypothetical protein
MNIYCWLEMSHCLGGAAGAHVVYSMHVFPAGEEADGPTVNVTWPDVVPLGDVTKVPVALQVASA